MSEFRLTIVTPDGAAFEGKAQALRLKTTEGYVSIRAGHADYVAALGVGMITVTVDGKDKNAACGGGFLSVEKGEVRLVATTFEYAENIDVERATLAKQVAEERIATTQDAGETALAKAKLLRALNRLSVAEQ